MSDYTPPEPSCNSPPTASATRNRQGETTGGYERHPPAFDQVRRPYICRTSTYGARAQFGTSNPRAVGRGNLKSFGLQVGNPQADHRPESVTPD